MNMIERVARAIYNDEYKYPPYDELVKSTKKNYCIRAKAAIEAMREPTDNQRNNYFAMRKEMGYPDIQCVMHDATWELMVDAALKE